MITRAGFAFGSKIELKRCLLLTFPHSCSSNSSSCRGIQSIVRIAQSMGTGRTSIFCHESVSDASPIPAGKMDFCPFQYCCHRHSFHTATIPAAGISADWRSGKLNHYQILGVKRDASSEVIRSAFLELSKNYHPDLNSADPQNHDKFVQINEAYSVLSKPLSRRNYDTLLVQLRNRSRARAMSHHTTSEEDENHAAESNPHYHSPHHEDPQFYQNRDKTRDEYYERQPYYGIANLPKVSNKTVVLICFSIIVVGAAIHFFVVSKLTDIHIENMNQRDRRAHKFWTDANDPTFNVQQIQLLKMKIQDREQAKRERTSATQGLDESVLPITHSVKKC